MHASLAPEALEMATDLAGQVQPREGFTANRTAEHEAHCPLNYCAIKVIWILVGFCDTSFLK